MIQDYQELLKEQRFSTIKEELEKMPAADASEQLTELPPTFRALVFRLLSKDHALDVFEMLESHEQQDLLDELQDHEVLQILEQMSADDRARLFDEMPAKVANRLLHRLTPERRDVTSLLLGYAPDTAGRIMAPDFVNLPEGLTVSQALARIRRVGLAPETIYYLYVTDSVRRLKGVVSLRQLVLADPELKIADIYTPDAVSVSTDTDQEQVARLIEAHDLLALPVVDSEERLVGIVTVDDALDVLDDEVTEDFHRLGGITASPSGGDPYFFLRPVQRTWKRLPWLAILLVAGVISGSLISAFEDALTAVIALAFFIPMVMDTAGNTGSQAVTLVVRAMATGDVQRRHYMRTLTSEMLTGVMLGAALGLLAGLVATVMTGESLLGISIGIALVGTVISAGLLGTGLPFLLNRVGIDPAVASTPLVTTMGDAIGLIIYFSIASLLYGI